MSRIGKMPIALPKGVTATVDSGAITVKGPKGELAVSLLPTISAAVEDGNLVVRRADDSRVSRASHGLVRALANNAVRGVSEGFSKRLEIQGVGFKADVRGDKLVLNLGYSHQVEFGIPKGIQISVDKDNKITVSGADKKAVGQVAAEIRSLRKPDRYKGKGVRYEGEYINLKAGKSA